MPLQRAKAKEKPSQVARGARRERKLKTTQKRQGSVKTWEVVDLGQGTIGITCPQPECRGKAKVAKKKWLMQQPDFASRGCTHCFKIAWIPDDLLPRNDPRRT